MNIAVRPISDSDIAEADRIFRLAFGTFLRLPDPMSFGADGELVRTRFRTPSVTALGAFDGSELVGSNFVTRWGSFGFFGPLTVRPDSWDRGVASRLLEATLPLFDAAGIRQAGLFTFPTSEKHIALYRKFGFEPQELTPLMRKTLEPAAAARSGSTIYSDLSPDRRSRALADCRELTDSIFHGLDVSAEIEAVADQGIGETVLVYAGDRLMAFGLCHIGAGSEARSQSAYVKFGAARPGPDAATWFQRVLRATEAVAASRGAVQIIAGVNSARRPALDILAGGGYDKMTDGIAMQRPDDAGFNRPDAFVVDDWR